MKRPIYLYILFVLHLILVISAIAGGTMMMYKPDGSLLGLDMSRLERTPFNDYLLPGLLLFLSNGVFSLFSLIGLVFEPFWKKANFLNIYPGMYWGWTYSLYTGIIVIIWITVQLLLTSYFWMHPVVIMIGLLIIIFTMIPANIYYFKKR